MKSTYIQMCVWTPACLSGRGHGAELLWNQASDSTSAVVFRLRYVEQLEFKTARFSLSQIQ